MASQATPAQLRRKRKLPRTLNREEVKRLLEAPNLRAPTGIRNRCMLEVMYRAGLRVGEVVALKPRDVDTKKGTIRVLNGKGGDGTAYFDTQRVGAVLDRWKAERSYLGVPKTAPLFCTLQGGPVSVRYVQQMVRRMAARAKLSGIAVTPHVLRHTFATELLDEGFSLAEVQEALRHADIRTTRVYTHVIDSQLRAKVQSRRSDA